MPFKDKERHRAYQQEYHKAYDHARYLERRSVLLVQLGGKCVYCGVSDDLEFDHIDSRTKLFDISERINRPPSSFADELAKCQLLCKPCHRKKSLTEGDVNAARHGTDHMYGRLKCRCDLCRRWKRDYSRRIRGSKVTETKLIPNQ